MPHAPHPIPPLQIHASVSTWRTRLSSLRVKLFLAIAITNMALVLLTYLIYSWSFDKGLVDYLNQADEVRLRPVIQRLAEDYKHQGNWNWLTNDQQRWIDLLREVMGSGRIPHDHPEPFRGNGGHQGDGPPPGFDMRFLLFDAQRELLLGPSNRRDQAVLKPIEVDKHIVGYLGYMPRLRMAASLEHVLQAEQLRIFAVICVGVLIAVLLNAAFIARWLAHRLRILGEGSATIARGDYSVRLPTDGHDELARLAEDFNRMAHSLQAARQTRRQWIADIAHELRTPLTTLRAEIEALQDGIRRPDAANLNSLAQETNRLTRLVEDLRMLSLSDLGALDYRFELLDFGRFVGNHLNDAASLHTYADLNLRCELAEHVHIRADGDRLDQVLSNLLQNTLRYSSAPATLHIRVQREADEAVLIWEDSAPGVPDEALPRLTERLFRLDASRASDSGGTGLGLAIVHAIVQGHDGHMAASASPLGGLRWEIRFPLIKEAAHA